MTWSRIYRGFKPGSILNIQVNRENQAGVSEWSNVIQHTCSDLLTPLAPTIGTLTINQVKIRGSSLRTVCSVAWTNATNTPISGTDVEIYSCASPPAGGVLPEKTIHRGADATTGSWTDTDPDSAYCARCRHVGKNSLEGAILYSSWSGWADATAPTPVISIDPPASANVDPSEDSFLVKWAAVTDLALKGYNIYVNTSNSFATSELIKSVGKTQQKVELKVGSSYAATTLLYDTAYYFWVTATNDNEANGGESTEVACTGNPVMVMKSIWLQHLTTPWKMTKPKFVTLDIEDADSDSYAIPSGRVALLYSYHLDGDGAANTYISAYKFGEYNFVIENTALSGPVITRGPAQINGIYFPEGSSVVITSSAAAGSHASFRLLEFDAISEVQGLIKEIKTVLGVETSYEVTAGKKLVITFATSLWTSSSDLQVWEGGAWVSIWDVTAETWRLSDGALQFPSETELCTPGTIGFFGYEVSTETAP